MCVDCPGGPLDRRSFLAGVAAGAGALAAPGAADPPRPDEVKALDDPAVAHRAVTFPSGTLKVDGYLARPRADGRYPPVVVLHGNPGLSEDVRNAAAQLAQAGFVGLVMDWGSRAPRPAGRQEEDRWLEYIRGYTFIKLQMDDVRAALDYLKAQPFVRPGGAGLVGFCGGGRVAVLFATRPSAVRAVVAFYAPARGRQFQNRADPIPELVDVAKEVQAPVQGHYGARDRVATAADARDFEAGLRAAGKAVEMYYYEGAGHSFYNHTRPPGSEPGFDYHPASAALARQRMVDFLKRHLGKTD
jgi:carboxymethylenebutenolidase